MRIYYLLVIFLTSFLSFNSYSFSNSFSLKNVSFLISTNDIDFFKSHQFDLGCTNSSHFSDFTQVVDSRILVNYEPTNFGSERIRYSCTTSVNYVQSFTAFKVFFSSDFDWVKGGKMHGVGSLHPRTGGRVANNRDWSLRLSFLERGQIAFYVYDSFTEGWGKIIKSSDFRFDTGQWYEVFFIVSLDKNNNSGSASLYIDNALILETDNIQLNLNVSGTSIQSAIFQTFHGGNNSTFTPLKGSYATFKDFIYFFL